MRSSSAAEGKATVPRFLVTSGVSYHLEELIKNATERLVIISPYLRVNERIKELLEDKDRMKIDVRVVYGKNDLQPAESKWLESMTSVRTSFCKNLHAKCYLNEKQALLTSMNLYEFSQQNNNEMGILVSQEEDADLYKDIREEAQRILRISEEPPITGASVENAEEAKSQPEASRSPIAAPAVSAKPEDGFCIRCKATIPADPRRPYCKAHFTSWNQYKNESYEERHCHTCDKENASTLLKPLCRACFGKHKDVFEFAVSRS